MLYAIEGASKEGHIEILELLLMLLDNTKIETENKDYIYRGRYQCCTRLPCRDCAANVRSLSEQKEAILKSKTDDKTRSE